MRKTTPYDKIPCGKPQGSSLKVPRELVTLISREKKLVVAAHINPDGDAVGSALALSLALESMGKETVVYDRDPIPEFYNFLPGHERFINSFPPLAAGGPPVVLLDCNEPRRIGLERAAIPFSVVVDHHETQKDYGDVKWIEPRAAATGVMVYYLIKALKVEITEDIATNLYTAVAVDTGTFRFGNTTSEVLRIAAELIDSGAEPAAIAGGLYESWSAGRLRLFIDVINTVEITGIVATAFVTEGMFLKTGASSDETENFSNFPLKSRDVKVSAFLREIEEGWKVSLRSKGDINVAEVASRFDGGGHKNAAGCKMKGDLKAAKEEIIKAIIGQSRSNKIREPD